jgi:hypothetical protein
LKKLLTIGLAGVAVVATLTIAAAHDILPPDEILATLRSMGLGPTGVLRRRGPYYVLHAYDARGLEVRVVADAQFGDILSVTPAREFVDFYVPTYIRGPRIIHVPLRDATDDDEDTTQPRPKHRSDATPSLFDGPSPIRRTPRHKVKAGRDAGNATRVPLSGGN